MSGGAVVGRCAGQPLSDEQRLANHRRGALVIDGERVYALVNHPGELLTIEMGLPTGVFDTGIGSGTADVHAVEFGPDGVLVHPVDLAAVDTPLPAQFGGVEPETARRMVRFTRRLDEAYARLEAARREGESSAVDAAAAEYRRLVQLSAAHTSAVVRRVSQAHGVPLLADKLGIEVSSIESLDERIAEYRQGSGRPTWAMEEALQSLESAAAEYRQAVLDERRAEIAMSFDDSSDPVGDDPPEWPGGAPLGLAAADLDARAETHWATFGLRVALHEQLRRAGDGSVAWVTERIDGQDVHYLLVVIPGQDGSRIVRVDRTGGEVWVVPLSDIVSAELSAAFFRPVRPQADSPPPEPRGPPALPSADTVAELRNRRDTRTDELAALGVHVDLEAGDSGATGWRRAIWRAMQSVRSEFADLDERHAGLADVLPRYRDEVAAPPTARREHAEAVERALVELDEVVRRLDSAETQLADDRDDVVSAEILAQILAQELVSRGGGERLSPHVAYFHGAEGQSHSLLIAAGQGRHMRALEELARARPWWADALWRPGLTREYRTVLDEETGPVSVSADGRDMERDYQARFERTVQRALLSAYLERAYGDFRRWLGPVTGRQRHTDVARPQLLRRVFRKSSRDRLLQSAERVVADAALRKFSVPDGPNPAGEPAHAITLGGMRIPVRLEAVSDQVRVAPPVGYEDATDLIAECCAGWSDDDPDRLLDRIREALPMLWLSRFEQTEAASSGEPVVYGRAVDPGDRSQADGPENFGRVYEFATRAQLLEHLTQLDPDATLRVRERYPDGDREYSVRLRDHLPVVVDAETGGAQEYSPEMPSELLTISRRCRRWRGQSIATDSGIRRVVADPAR